jgi:hypothetical protein
MLWNTVYLAHATNALRGHGQQVDDALRQYLSPSGWEYITKLGFGNFRPLCSLTTV